MGVTQLTKTNKMPFGLIPNEGNVREYVRVAIHMSNVRDDVNACFDMTSLLGILHRTQILKNKATSQMERNAYDLIISHFLDENWGENFMARKDTFGMIHNDDASKKLKEWCQNMADEFVLES